MGMNWIITSYYKSDDKKTKLDKKLLGLKYLKQWKDVCDYFKNKRRR